MSLNRYSISLGGVLLILCLLLIISYIFFNPSKHSASDDEKDCFEDQQIALALGFKEDVLVLGILGAIIAGLCYSLFLHYQIFLTRSDFLPPLISCIIGTFIGYFFIWIDYFTGPECLKLGLNLRSRAAEIIKKLSISGHLGVSNLWLAIILDLFLFSLIVVGFSYWKRSDNLKKYSLQKYGGKNE